MSDDKPGKLVRLIRWYYHYIAPRLQRTFESYTYEQPLAGEQELRGAQEAEGLT